MVVIGSTRRYVLGARLSLVKCDCLAQLLDCGRVQVLLVKNPSQRIDESRHILISLHYSLGQSHRLVEIAVAGSGVEPGKIVGGNRRVRILLEGFTIVI